MDMSHVAAVFRNDGMNSSKWSNVIGEPIMAEPGLHQPVSAGLLR